MQANWSLMLNVLLLVGVIAAIVHLLKMRKQSLAASGIQPFLGQVNQKIPETSAFPDDIIAVRKVNPEEGSELEMEYQTQASLLKKNTMKPQKPRLMLEEEFLVEKKEEPKIQEQSAQEQTGPTVMVFLVAKEHRQFAGYELLQTVLASGLRFGEGHLFHRHQLANGQGSILCSLAAATATGVFDLQNIGAFSVRGLCLFMQVSKNRDTNEERFSTLMDTARQLSEGLDAYLLDDQRQPLTEERLARYHRILDIELQEA